MRSLKSAAVITALAVSSIAAITYSSCKKDYCKTVTCKNGGVCKDGLCTCPTGFTGPNCETDVRKFVKTWSATDTLSGTTTPIRYNCTVSLSPDQVSATFANSFFNTAMPFTYATDGKSILIGFYNDVKRKDVDGVEYNVNGKGELQADGSLKWSYTFTRTSDNSKKQYTGLWK